MKTFKASRGTPSLLTSGAATSAAHMKRRFGVRCSAGLVTVENGRQITVAELCRSVSQAATRFLNTRGLQPEGFRR